MAEKVVIKKSQNSLLKPIGAFFRRFHLLLFFILIIGCLAVAVIFINKILTDEPDDGYMSPINPGQIDRETLEKVQSMHPSSQPTTPTLPQGRINPFAE